MTKEMAITILRGAVLGTDEQTHEAVFMAIKALKEQARIDAVEVVRCKDCKWYKRKYILHRRTYSWNEHYTECSYLEAPMDDNDYCSLGERKDEVKDE